MLDRRLGRQLAVAKFQGSRVREWRCGVCSGRTRGGPVPIYGALIAAALTLASCGEPKRIVTALPTPAERLICEKAGARPTLPGEYVVAWDHVAAARTVPEAVARAQSEHAKFVAVIRTREGIVAGYILKLEGVNHVCYTNAEWRRQFETATAAPAG